MDDVYGMFFNVLNTGFVGSTHTINMFNFIDIYSFIPASACVGMGPSALLCLGACIAAKMALYHYIYLLLIKLKYLL
jgi:hypothetical protein